MNFLSNIFKSKDSYSELNNSDNSGIDKDLATAVESISTPDKNLFVDSAAPSIELEPVSKISSFLGRNFYSMGLRHGYDFHSSENSTLGKRKIGAEFRYVLDQEIQDRENKLLRLENSIVDVSLISETTLKKLQNTLLTVKSSISLLKVQKELSVDDEGWVMNAIYGYKQGYSQGLTDYIDSEALLSSINNI
jgi:hypothetical protein